MPNLDRFEKSANEYFDQKNSSQIDIALKSLVRLIRINRKNKEYKKLLYHTLFALSVYIDSAKNEQMRLRELLQYLIFKGNMSEIMEDLNSRMIVQEEESYAHMTYKQQVIVNPLAFESYIYCLKQILYNLISNKWTESELEMLKRRFIQLQNLAENKKETNKYHIGKSPGLIEMVEYLFLTKLEANKYSKSIQAQIMKNRLRVIEQWSGPLLNCLRAALPFHAEPSHLKRYLRILSNLAYSIREADTTSDSRDDYEELDDKRSNATTPKGQLQPKGS